MFDYDKNVVAIADRLPKYFEYIYFDRSKRKE